MGYHIQYVSIRFTLLTKHQTSASVSSGSVLAKVVCVLSLLVEVVSALSVLTDLEVVCILLVLTKVFCAVLYRTCGGGQRIISDCRGSLCTIDICGHSLSTKPFTNKLRQYCKLNEWFNFFNRIINKICVYCCRKNL